jgi:hypothetical protein
MLIKATRETEIFIIGDRICVSQTLLDGTNAVVDLSCDQAQILLRELPDMINLLEAQKQ